MAISLVTRPPSLQRTYDAFWAGDPAFVQGDSKEHLRKLATARETGDWSSLLIAGLSPTKFVMRHIPLQIKNRILDQFSAGKIGGLEFDDVLVRVACIDVVDLGDFKWKSANDERWGRVAAPELTDLLSEVAPGAVGDLAVQVYNRMMGLSGKS